MLRDIPSSLDEIYSLDLFPQDEKTDFNDH